MSAGRKIISLILKLISEPPPRPRGAHCGLAAEQEHVRRLVHLPPEGRGGRSAAGGSRLRHRPGLRQPLHQPLQRVPAVQAASVHQGYV